MTPLICPPDWHLAPSTHEGVGLPGGLETHLLHGHITSHHITHAWPISCMTKGTSHRIHMPCTWHGMHTPMPEGHGGTGHHQS